MRRPTCAAAIIFVLSTAGATYAQSPTRTPQTGNDCAMDYNCNTRPTGKSIGTDSTTDSDAAANATRLQNETLTPRTSNEPEEPEQPIEPEAPISNAH